MAIENKILTFGGNKIGTVGGNKLMGYVEPFPPLWENPYNFEKWYNRLKENIKSNTQLIPFNPTTFDTTFSETGDFRLYGGALAPNDCIYTCPFNSPNIYKINTINDVVTRFVHGVSGASLFLGAINYKNLIIYSPYNADNIMVVDTANSDAISFYGTLIGTGKYGKPILAENGLIYFPPFNANHWVEFNPETFSINIINLPLVNTSQYNGIQQCIAGGNGFIYGLPQGASKTFTRLNLSTNEITQIGSVQTIRCGCGVLYDDKIIAPADQSSEGVIRILHIDSNVVTTVSAVNQSCNAVTIGADGWVYMPQGYGANSPSYRYNPITTVLETYTNTLAGNRIASCVLARNGDIYYIPLQLSTGFRKISSKDETGFLSEEQIFSRVINKG